MDLVVFSLIFRRSGDFFVDVSSKWWFFRCFFVETVVFSLIFRYLGVTLENEAYMLGLGGAKKRKC